MSRREVYGFERPLAQPAHEVIPSKKVNAALLAAVRLRASVNLTDQALETARQAVEDGIEADQQAAAGALRNGWEDPGRPAGTAAKEGLEDAEHKAGTARRASRDARDELIALLHSERPALLEKLNARELKLAEEARSKAQELGELLRERSRVQAAKIWVDNPAVWHPRNSSAAGLVAQVQEELRPPVETMAAAVAVGMDRRVA